MKITQDSQTALTVAFSDGAGAETYTQFGMRYPDGTIKWGYDHEAYGGSTFFEGLDEGERAGAWRKRLERRAAAASIQFSEYLEGHQLIKRTVIVAVTGFEEV